VKKILTIIVVVLALQLVLVSAAFASGGNYHKVRYGETLYSIGRHYGVSPYRISEANNLYNPNYIYAGQVLHIPAGGGYGYDYGKGYDGGKGYDRVRYDDRGQYDYYRGGRDDYHGGKGGDYHKVRYGETLYSIGRHYGVNPYRISEANGLYNPNHIYAGQVLYIPSGYGYGNMPDYGKKPGYGNMPDHGRKPVDRDWGQRPGYDGGCQSGCQQYGYDYTGYYYGQGDNRYSYTCGYYYNCW
jgi:LysM repeat protein